MARLCDHCGKMHPDGVAECATEQGAKWDDGKCDWAFLPSKALEPVLKIYAGGAKKYGQGNYKKGISYSRVFSAAMRHLWAWWRGEDLDRESGLSHLAHACWNVLTLLEYEDDRNKYKTFDDRVKYGSLVQGATLNSSESVGCKDLDCGCRCEHVWIWQSQYSDTTGLHVNLKCSKCFAHKTENYGLPEPTTTVSIPSVWFPDGSGGISEATVTTSCSHDDGTMYTLHLIKPEEKTA